MTLTLGCGAKEEPESFDNVTPCNELEAELQACTPSVEIDFGCEQYASVDCNLADYFACLNNAYGACDESTMTFADFDPLALADCAGLTSCEGTGSSSAGSSSGSETDSTDGTSGSGATDSESTGSGDTGGGGEPCVGTPGFAPIGASCTRNEDCESLFCYAFSDAPADPDAYCQSASASCETRVVGTVRDIETRAAIAGAQVRIVGLISASVNPQSAPSLASGTTDENGRLDIETTAQVEQPVGLGSLIVASSYADSLALVSEPVDIQSATFYGPGVDAQDQWVVSAATVSAWSATLAQDPSLIDYLPLEDEGGFVGIAVDAQSGQPRAGVSIVSEAGSGTQAMIRYLANGGSSFSSSATDSSGLFVILNPGVGETFGMGTQGFSVVTASGVITTRALALP